MKPLHEHTLAELSGLLQRREVSSEEIVRHCLERARRHDDLGAFLHLAPDAARAQARESDALRAQGDARPLLGLPLAHKDILVTRDMPSTAASEAVIPASAARPSSATALRRERRVNRPSRESTLAYYLLA